MIILRKYWKIIGLLISIGIIAGSIFFLYERNISLEKTVQTQQISLQTKDAQINEAKRERDLIDSINVKNNKEKNIILDKLNQANSQINSLKKDAMKNDEKGAECLNVPEPKSLNNWLRQQSSGE